MQRCQDGFTGSYGRVTPHGAGPTRAVASANMTALKTKAGRLFLALGMGLSISVIVASLAGCASNQHPSNPDQSRSYLKPTFEGDDHAQPVYTSPTVATAPTNLPASTTPP